MTQYFTLGQTLTKRALNIKVVPRDLEKATGFNLFKITTTANKQKYQKYSLQQTFQSHVNAHMNFYQVKRLK